MENLLFSNIYQHECIDQVGRIVVDFSAKLSLVLVAKTCCLLKRKFGEIYIRRGVLQIITSFYA